MGWNEAKMQMIGCDLHDRQQASAILDTETGELEECVLEHAGNTVRNFHAHLALPARVGIEAIGSVHWSLELMERGIECQTGYPAKIFQKMSQLPCNEFFSEIADLPLWLGVQNVGLRHSKQLQYHNVATRKNDYGGRFRCSQQQQTLEN